MLPLLQLFHTWLPVLLVLPLVLVLFLPVAAAGSHYTTRGRPDDAAARAEETQRLLELAAEDFRDHWWLVRRHRPASAPAAAAATAPRAQLQVRRTLTVALRIPGLYRSSRRMTSRWRRS